MTTLNLFPCQPRTPETSPLHPIQSCSWSLCVCSPTTTRRRTPLAPGTSKPYSAHWPLPLWYKPSYSRIGRYGTPCYTDPPAQMAPQTLSPSPKDLN